MHFVCMLYELKKDVQMNEEQEEKKNLTNYNNKEKQEKDKMSTNSYLICLLQLTHALISILFSPLNIYV